MELVINEFFIHSPLIWSTINNIIISIESSKGIYSILIYSFPLLTINIISNDYLIINTVNNIMKYSNLSDLVSILGSIDFVLGSIDLLRFID